MTKQSDIEMVAKARACAVKAHAGQKDKAGQDYFKAHVTVVAEGVKGDPIAEAVAFLHDTVEDTSVTIEDIRTGFPKEVADAVTRTPVLETTDGSAEINAPIDLALADYESRMANALGVLCSYEDVLLSNVIVRIVAWRPVKQ